MYFWEDTHVPFTERRDPVQRNNMLKADTEKLSGYVIGGGSLPKWDTAWLHAFDLVVFLYTASGRTLNVHKEWIEKFTCPVL